jgi:hypothetical protein
VLPGAPNRKWMDQAPSGFAGKCPNVRPDTIFLSDCQT